MQATHSLDAASPTHGTAAAAAATPGARLAAYGLLSYAAVALHALVFAADVRVMNLATVAFVAVVHVTYAALYTAAGLLPAVVVDRVLAIPAIRRRAAPGRVGATRRAAVAVAAVAGVGLVQFALFADAFLHRRYGFHLNGMVWNLVTTPGGIESMGASRGTEIAIGAVAVACVLVQAALFHMARRWNALGARIGGWPRRRLVACAAALLVASGAERVAFGVSDAGGYAPVTTAASAYPLYQRARFVSLARTLGVATDEGEVATAADLDGIRLRYPLEPLRRTEGARDLNVLWLVAESLRADALNDEVMPQTSAFARESIRFTNHRSGGNGTRMGVFSMFYGLHGSYWFPFLAESRGPAVLDAMIDGGWDVAASTSAKFTFPEFDRTVFSRFPRDRLTEGDPEQKGWQNDRALVTKLIDGIDGRDASRPFFRFQFFESPHAPYLFPKDAIVRPDFERDLNYVTMDLSDAAQVGRIRNRYLNACHHLDQQLGRVFDHLRTGGLLDSTVVILTGDHGEEFMEKGRWGHHSAFSEEQIRTPLVIRAPGVAPRVVSDPTSHADLPATVLALLGFENPPSDFSFGSDLLGGARRDHVVVADWENLAWVGARHKIVLPVRGMSWSGDDVTTVDDAPVPDARALRTEHRTDIARLLGEIGRFKR